MTAIWSDPYYGQSDKTKLLVALAIADSARSEDGKAWPGIEYIARKSRCSSRAAQIAIQELQKDGKVMVELNTGPHGTNTYLLCTEGEASSGVKPVRGEKKRQRISPGGVKSTGSGFHPNHKETPFEPSGTFPSPAGEKSPHTEFVELWTAEYEKAHQCRYAFKGGKDGMHVKELLATSKLSPSELIAIAKTAWQRPTGFNCKSAVSISGFNSRFNEIRAEIQSGNGSHKQPTTAIRENIKCKILEIE